MKREQLMADFEETFQNQFKQGNLQADKEINVNSQKPEYVDEHTRQMFSVWICAFETYSYTGFVNS